MKPITNPDLYWRIRELAVTARCTVGDLLREAKVSTAAAHAWTHGHKIPRPNTLMRITHAHARLKEKAK